MSFILTVLGIGSASPGLGRHMTSHLLQHGKHTYMIDCGEGTQVQLQQHGAKIRNLSRIFITHLHGDHYFGLPGLISSLNLGKRKSPLHLHGPRGLDEILTTQFKHGDSALDFPLIFHETPTDEPVCVYDSEELSVTTIPLYHRIPCAGYLFREKLGLRKLKPELLPEDLPFSEYHKLKKGEVVTFKGQQINPETVTDPPSPPASYAFCSDTAYLPHLAEQLAGVSCLYHETTFMEKEAERAVITRHSTAKQAALLAKSAEVGQLLMGHFSLRYADLSPLLAEAKDIFPQAMLAEEGKRYEIG